MERIGNDLDIVICYEDFIHLKEVVDTNFVLLEKIRKSMIMEKNTEQIRILNDVVFIHRNILNSIVRILEQGKRKVYE